MTVDLLWTGPEAGPTLVLGHGARAAMDSSGHNSLSSALVRVGLPTGLFKVVLYVLL